MSLIGKIQTLFSDKAKTTPVFPRTKVKAVSDDNGVGLDALLDDVEADILAAQAAANNAQTTANNAQTTANNAMPKSGGYFTGDAKGTAVPSGNWSFKNITIFTAAWDETGTNTERVIMLRK